LKILKLARVSLLQHTRLCERLKIHEPIAYDGAENFAKSQYEPNNINHAIGDKSRFIYDFGFAPLNRKGRMSDRQKLKKAELEQLQGRFPRNAIQKSTTQLITRLLDRCEPGSKLQLQTDEHYLYKRSIQQDLFSLGLTEQYHVRIEHITISSKATRLYKHILFSVNHTDLLIRQHVKAFARETIGFSKTHEDMCLKYALFMVWKNYFRPQFTKAHKRDPRTNTTTPAMALGLTDSIPRFGEFFGLRLSPTQVPLSDEWKHFYFRQPVFQKIKRA
jgi:hypothetical protein